MLINYIEHIANSHTTLQTLNIRLAINVYYVYNKIIQVKYTQLAVQSSIRDCSQ
ncbi:hypothetical protein CAXC1_220033 [Candidatus Xenohaliotis californiensis]|uniref:Uncharacterized protein n=1 Tax=Candidatus Xenohaliotis californiensis TaxID=84677 RepID=A0ABP0ESM7_9RICK|nr:hypothetical protein CAXC1_220033 [Candidatus Xenohaliotis californiensis]